MKGEANISNISSANCPISGDEYSRKNFPLNDKVNDLLNTMIKYGITDETVPEFTSKSSYMNWRRRCLNKIKKCSSNDIIDVQDCLKNIVDNVVTTIEDEIYNDNL